MSLKGKEMIWGGIIRMPMAISMDATTKSMIKKGRYSKKTIWKATLISLTIKAGISTLKGISFGDLILSLSSLLIPDTSKKIFMVSFLVCLAMNSFNMSEVLSKNT